MTSQVVEGCWIRVSSYGVYILPNRISPFSYYEIVARFWFYLSLFLLPKSLLILSNTVLRGSWIFGLLPLKESWDMTWIIIQSTIFLSLSFLIQSVIPSFTELLNSSGSYIIINSKRDTLAFVAGPNFYHHGGCILARVHRYNVLIFHSSCLFTCWQFW